MRKLTAREKRWIADVQEVLDRCPSPGEIGFYTIGGPSIMLYDLRRVDDVMDALDRRTSGDWCTAVQDLGVGFDEIIEFPSAVESTAG